MSLEGAPIRIGFGYDVHRLTTGRPLVLGGVTIPSEVGLLGHSDADALLHAITDAILGALAMGDIGALFPDTDPAYKNADSTVLLAEVMRQVREKGWTVGNVDATVVLERPKLRPFISEMCDRIAEVLGCPPGAVSVKATTSERMGFVGVGDGAAAYAVCTMYRGSAGG